MHATKRLAALKTNAHRKFWNVNIFGQNFDGEIFWSIALVEIWAVFPRKEIAAAYVNSSARLDQENQGEKRVAALISWSWITLQARELLRFYWHFLLLILSSPRFQEFAAICKRRWETPKAQKQGKSPFNLNFLALKSGPKINIMSFKGNF